MSGGTRTRRSTCGARSSGKPRSPRALAEPLVAGGAARHRARARDRPDALRVPYARRGVRLRRARARPPNGRRRRARSPPAPAPAGFRDLTPQPSAAYYHAPMGIFILPYAAVRAAPSPDDAVMAFLHGTYDAAANLAGWDRKALERPISDSASPARRETRER